MVIDVVGADHCACELLEEIILLVGGAVGADDADGFRAVLIAEFAEALAGEGEGLFPGDGLEFSICLPNQGRREALDVVGEVEGVATLIAEEVAVDAGLVAVVATDNFRAFGDRADAEGGLASIAAMGADGGYVVHLPGPRFIAVGAGGEGADGAGVDAHATLLAIEIGEVFRRKLRRNVWGDDGRAATVLNAEGEDVHAFAAHADATIAEDAAGPVEVDDGGPLLLFAMVLGFGIEAVGGTVLEGHVLELAFATSVADGAVERVVAEEELEGGLSCLCDLRSFGRYDHAFGDGGGAGGLELGHLLDANDAHAAGSLEGEAGIVAESGNFDARGLAGFDEERAGGGGELLAVYGEIYVWHKVLCPNPDLYRGLPRGAMGVNWAERSLHPPSKCCAT